MVAKPRQGCRDRLVPGRGTDPEGLLELRRVDHEGLLEVGDHLEHFPHVLVEQAPEAEQEFRTVLRMEPDSAYGYYGLGLTFSKYEKYEKAIENFEIFLDLWKDADPGLAEVEDARNRLASLKSEY